jgi:hypothetical protein
MRIDRAAAAALVAVLVGVGGCSNQRHVTPTATPTLSVQMGIIEGTTGLCYGPAGPPPNATAPVVLTNLAGSEIARQQVNKPYNFHFDVAPGTYIVSGTGAKSVTVSVRLGQTVHVKLIVACV